MRFTRILLVSLLLAFTAIAVSAQTEQTAPDAQRPQAVPSDQATQPDQTTQPAAAQTAPDSEAAGPAPISAINPDESVPLTIFKPEVLTFGEPQADFVQHMQPVLFDLDVYDHPANADAINADAQYLKDHPSVKFWLNGYADVRGDILYNMTLSQRRVETVRNALVQAGIPSDRILIDVGWGKLYPICADMTEECLQKNRRVHFVYVP